MGLAQTPRIARNIAASPFFALAIVALLAAAAGDGLTEHLRYDRQAVDAGQLWRLVTGHLVHLGWSHAILNVAGLVLVAVLVGRDLTAPLWWLTAGVSIIAVDLGLWMLSPELIRYVGASGLLHGLLAAGLVAGCRARRPDALLLAVLLVAKLVYEQWLGPLPGSESATGARVIVDAHLYGAVGGVLVGVVGTHKRASV